MDLSDWFKGFEKGMARLSQEQRSAFFSECGKRCVNCGTLAVYRQLYDEAGGDMDAFFMKANGLPGVRGEVAEKGRVKRAGCTIFHSWNAPASCASTDIFPRRCCVNVHARVLFIHCKASGTAGSSGSRSAIPFYRADVTAN